LQRRGSAAPLETMALLAIAAAVGAVLRDSNASAELA
jgi:hypothetical protein